MKWNTVIYRMLKRYDDVCTPRNCNGTKRLHSDLSLLIEDLLRVPNNNEKDRIVSCVKNVNSCTNCVFSNHKVNVALNILSLIKEADKSYTHLKKIYEKKAAKMRFYECDRCQRFDIVFGEFAFMVAISLNPYSNLVLKPSSKVNPYGVASTVICTTNNPSCENIPLIQGILDDVANDYIESVSKIRIEHKKVDVNYRPQKKPILFEDEETKLNKIMNDPYFNYVVSIDHQIPSVRKIELETLANYISLLKLFEVIDKNIDASTLIDRWNELLFKRKLNILEYEVKLIKCAIVLGSVSSSYHLYEKYDALNFLLSQSKKTKEMIVNELKDKTNKNNAELFILDHIYKV